MDNSFPPAVPEIPVSDLTTAISYYKNVLGFSIDWGGEEGGIAGVSKDSCRMFLTNAPFREIYGNVPPVLIWFNPDSKEEVDRLFDAWSGAGAKVLSSPASKPWGLYEFTVADLDGNMFRVFYDFVTPANSGSV